MFFFLGAPDVLVFFSGLGFGGMGGVGGAAGLYSNVAFFSAACLWRPFSVHVLLWGCLTYRLFFLRLLRACVKPPE